jgi:hypothetical protein
VYFEDVHSFSCQINQTFGINGYLNIVRILHLESGLPNPLDKNFELNLIKRGVSRQLGAPAVQKLPINVDILKGLYSHFNMKSAFDVAFGRL